MHSEIYTKLGLQWKTPYYFEFWFSGVIMDFGEYGSIPCTLEGRDMVDHDMMDMMGHEIIDMMGNDMMTDMMCHDMIDMIGYDMVDMIGHAMIERMWH